MAMYLDRHKDANHSDFCGIILIFKADFRITILNVKITANNKFKMVQDKITVLLLPLHQLYLITRSNKKADWFVRNLLEKRYFSG